MGPVDRLSQVVFLLNADSLLATKSAETARAGADGELHATSVAPSAWNPWHRPYKTRPPSLLVTRKPSWHIKHRVRDRGALSQAGSRHSHLSPPFPIDTGVLRDCTLPRVLKLPRTFSGEGAAVLGCGGDRGSRDFVAVESTPPPDQFSRPPTVRPLL